MPLIKRLFEDSKFILRYIYLFFKNGFKTKTILFYPEFPSKRTVTYKIIRFLGWNITNNPKLRAKHGIFWHNVTFRESKDVQFLKNTGLNIINIDCTDISKKYVDKIFEQVFGYSLIIDPVTFSGIAVKKSDENAKHDGKIINCPIHKKDVDEKYIYMRLINNQINNTQVEDIRVPIFNNKIPFAYLKYRPINDRFSNTNTLAKLTEIETVISKEEQKKIIEFSSAIGLNYGEIDILRDRNDNKLYIVDVNYTPWGPPNHLKKGYSKIAVKKLSTYFKDEFLS